jgi:hypothetical protein
MARRSGFVSNARAAPPDFFLRAKILASLADCNGGSIAPCGSPAQLLLGLALIFATMLAVEGLPQTSPTASPPPQTN